MSTTTIDSSLANGLAEHAEPGLFRIPKEAHSLAGFRRWVLSDKVPEKLPVSFLKGEVYVDMSKEEIFYHAAVKTAVAGTMFNLNQEVDFGDLFINGVLVTNKLASVSNNPDMVAIFWPSLDKGLCKYISRGKRGVDWIIDARGKEIGFQVLAWRKAAYSAVPQHDGWIRSRVFGREFRLTRTQDRRGAWKYTLEYR